MFHEGGWYEMRSQSHTKDRKGLSPRQPRSGSQKPSGVRGCPQSGARRPSRARGHAHKGTAWWGCWSQAEREGYSCMCIKAPFRVLPPRWSSEP